MALRNAKPLTIRPKGLSDAADGSNSFPGAMASLQNLIPDPSTTDVFICRPASTQLTGFSGFTTPGFVSSLLIVGDIAYGTIATGRNAGHDEPFVYNLKTAAFATIANVTAANTPTSPTTAGDWTPPILALVGTRVIFTHPGFAGGAQKFGWLDLSNFSSATITGTTHTNTLIDTLSFNVLQAGWAVGQRITGTNIPANTFIVSIAVGGLSIIISQAATGGAALTTFTVTGGSAVTPLWGAGDTNINNLPSTPVGVANFNGRAWYACGAGVVFSDSLIPTQVTNASQALTFANGVNVTALGPLGLASPIVGGVVQALIVFQGVSVVQQIAGDAATNNLTVNALRGSTGTFAPLSLAPTTTGLTFMSPEGLRLVDLNGNISPPTGDAGKGVTVPFIYAMFPSRICAAAGADTTRMTVQNGSPYVLNAPNQDYWYDQTRQVWHGPHSFPYDQVENWNNTFVIVPKGVLASLWRSDPIVTGASSFTENGVALTWMAQTVLLPDNENMSMNKIVDSTIAISFPNAGVLNSVSVVAADEQGSVLAQAYPTLVIATPTLWGLVTWGSFLWGGGSTKIAQHRIPWPFPLVFKQASFACSGLSTNQFKLGNLYLKYQILNYLIENQ